MTEMIRSAGLCVSESDWPLLSKYERLWSVPLAENEDFLSITVWRLTSDPTRYIALNHYATPEAALRIEEEATKSGLLVDLMGSWEEPPDLRFIRIEAREGLVPDQVEFKHLASFSTRVADTGLGDELSSELTHIFEELKLMDGFLGCMKGRLEGVPEEIIGVAFWRTREAFQKSLPSKAQYKVDLFERVI
ncbi:MAG: hypothetical protein IH945_03100 [Armatimonadetes bacterium]|nr:hypothetical protein [Armatimonadota bacterium]